MKVRNTQQLNHRLLAACQQPAQLAAITSLEDLIKDEQRNGRQKNPQLPVRYGKKPPNTENTMATAPTSTSIVLPTNTSIGGHLQAVTSIPTQKPVREGAKMRVAVNERSPAIRYVQNSNQTLQQCRSVSPCRPITPAVSPMVVRVHSPPANQIIEIKYSSPNATLPAQRPIEKNIHPHPMIATFKPENSLSEAKIVRIPQPKQELIRQEPKRQPDQHQIKQNNNQSLVQPIIHIDKPKPELPKLGNLPNSPRILEMNMREQKHPTPRNATTISTKIEMIATEPLIKQNPFEISAKKDKQPLVQPSTILVTSPFDSQPPSEQPTIKPVIIEKSSINHLNSIYSNAFLKEGERLLQPPQKIEKSRQKPPKPTKKNSIGVGTSLHFQQIDDLEARCINYQRQLDHLKSMSLVEQETEDLYVQRYNYQYNTNVEQRSHPVYEMVKKPSTTEQLSTGANSKSSTVLSPFELSNMLREEQPEQEEDSFYFKELRLERILKKYRSKEDIFNQFDYE